MRDQNQPLNQTGFWERVSRCSKGSWRDDASLHQPRMWSLISYYAISFLTENLACAAARLQYSPCSPALGFSINFPFFNGASC